MVVDRMVPMILSSVERAGEDIGDRLRYGFVDLATATNFSE